MGQYYYLDGQIPIGPFGLREIYTLLDREVIDSATLVCREGGAEWQELINIHELTGRVRARTATRNSGSDDVSGSSVASEDSSRRKRRRGSSSELNLPKRGTPNRLINLNAIIIAVLFSVVAIYVTYTIGHANQEVSIDQVVDEPPTK